MFDLEKAIERNRLVKSMRTMSKEELTKMPPCNHKCPVWLGDNFCCKACGSNFGFYTEDEKIKLSDNINELLSRPKGALGSDGCEIPRKLRSMVCLRELCNPFMQVAGVTNG